MEFLGVPRITSVEVFDAIVLSLNDDALARRLTSERPAILVQCGAYSAHARAGALASMKPSGYAPKHVTVGELEELFRRLKKNKTPRRLYDELISRAALNRCPYCSDRAPSTLDHYLSLKKFSALTVLALNLVPACPECNSKKGAFEQSNAGFRGATLHPYYDNVSRTRWLRAVIVEVDGGPVARFYVDGAGIATPPLRARAASHLRALELRTHFKVKAAQEIAGLDDRMPRLLLERGESAVVKELREQAEQRSSNRVNSWERALYEALSNDRWYLARYLPDLASRTPGGEDPRRPIAL
ncbi:DNA-directed RNA polymerase subunit RPC12/RpoP [Agrococcus sp. UYP33]